MASSGTFISFSGDSNQGVQVGHNSGNILIAASERPETPPQPSCFVPFRRDPHFVDRGTLLDDIRDRCHQPASRVALVGIGGVGKSQLAIEHCYRTAERSPETWIFWVHASNTARLREGFQEIAEQVKVHGRKDPQVDVFKLVHDWLRDRKNGPWLLVIDNADDDTVLSPSSTACQSESVATRNNEDSSSSGSLQKHISRYLPPSSYGAVLVTSRTRHAATRIVEDSDVILIEPMQNVDAEELLHKKLGHDLDDNTSIAELAAALDHMPLALAQAAAHINKRAPRYSVQEFLEEYRQSDVNRTSLLNQEAGHMRRDETASNSVLTTWQMSFDHVRRTRRSSADLLSLMSFFDRQGIQDYLLHKPDSTEDRRNFEEDVALLRDFAFIKVTKDLNTFEMHSLVQLATRTWLEKQGQIDSWRSHFTFNLCAEFPDAEYKNWNTCQALFPHVKAAITQRPEDYKALEKWSLLLENAAWYAISQGRGHEAEHMSLKMMEAARRAFGEEHELTLSGMHVLAQARRLNVNYKEAETIFRDLIPRMTKALGHKHVKTISATHNLALVFEHQGKYRGAEVINREILAWKKEVLGPQDPDTLMSMNNLAAVLHKQGKFKEAKALGRKTLALRNKVLGPQHPDTLISMNNLAAALYQQGKFKAAEAMHRETLERRGKALGPPHLETLISMNNLALVLCSQGKYKEAEAIYRETLERREKDLGPEHPGTLASLHNLALILGEQRCYKESLALYERACAGRQKVLGKEHPNTRICLRNYARARSDAAKAQSMVPSASEIVDYSASAPTRVASTPSQRISRLRRKRMSRSKSKGPSEHSK